MQWINKFPLSLSINYFRHRPLPFWFSWLWQSPDMASFESLGQINCIRHLAFLGFLLLTTKKSNEVNWKAIKSIPWAVHDLWIDMIWNENSYQNLETKHSAVDVHLKSKFLPLFFKDNVVDFYLKSIFLIHFLRP